MTANQDKVSFHFFQFTVLVSPCVRKKTEISELRYQMEPSAHRAKLSPNPNPSLCGVREQRLLSRECGQIQFSVLIKGYAQCEYVSWHASYGVDVYATIALNAQCLRFPHCFRDSTQSPLSSFNRTIHFLINSANGHVKNPFNKILSHLQWFTKYDVAV